MGVFQRLLMRLEIAGHAVEALAEIGELVPAGDGDAMGQVAFGKLAVPRKSSASGARSRAAIASRARASPEWRARHGSG